MSIPPSITNSRAVLITGANRGLGLGLAREFARRGWAVHAGCRRPDAVPALKDPPGIRPLVLDVCDESSVRSALAQVVAEGGRLDVVINNAGINPEPRDLGVADVPIGQVAQALEVNLLGALRVLQAAVPLLRASARPRVVNISSGAGSLAHNSAARPIPAYCISKAALNMLTRRAARDLPGITVVSVSPGWVRTDMGGPDAALGVDDVAPHLAATIEELRPEHTGQWLDRFGRPSEYAW